MHLNGKKIGKCHVMAMAENLLRMSVYRTIGPLVYVSGLGMKMGIFRQYIRVVMALDLLNIPIHSILSICFKLFTVLYRSSYLEGVVWCCTWAKFVNYVQIYGLGFV